MATIAMSGADTVSVNNRILADSADGNIAELSFDNQIANVKTGKNGNSIFADNQTGNNGKLILRVIRGSSDDKFLNNLLIQQQANFGGTVLVNAELIKKMGDGQGNIGSDIYAANSGIFSKKVAAKSNVDGDTEQSVSIYELMFANVIRVIS